MAANIDDIKRFLKRLGDDLVSRSSFVIVGLDDISVYLVEGDGVRLRVMYYDADDLFNATFGYNFKKYNYLLSINESTTVVAANIEIWKAYEDALRRFGL
jgi:hypothetical protein